MRGIPFLVAVLIVGMIGTKAIQVIQYFEPEDTPLAIRAEVEPGEEIHRLAEPPLPDLPITSMMQEIEQVHGRILQTMQPIIMRIIVVAGMFLWMVDMGLFSFCSRATSTTSGAAPPAETQRPISPSPPVQLTPPRGRRILLSPHD